MEIEQKYQKFLRNWNRQNLDEVLIACLDNGSTQGLAFAQKLFAGDDSAGGFEWEVKQAAACCLLAFGTEGPKTLKEGALVRPTFKNVVITIEALASAASAESLVRYAKAFVSQGVIDRIQAIDYAMTGFGKIAESTLRAMLLDLDDDEDLVSYVGTAVQRLSISGSDAFKQLIFALSTRWSAVSTPVLRRYDELIALYPDEESRYQGFFEEYPQLLDPMAYEVWSRPDFHGAKEPDFVIRRSDDTYVVVEIEVPGKSLITAAGQVSAETTHAITQVMQYRTFLLERHAEAEKHFPYFRDLQGLVVAGLEGLLNQMQRKALMMENHHRSGLRIVGFDWIKRRAEAIQKNLISLLKSSATIG